MSNNKIPSVRLNRSHKWQLESNLINILPFELKEELDSKIQSIFDLVVEELKIVFPREDMEIIRKYSSREKYKSGEKMTRRLEFSTSSFPSNGGFRYTFENNFVELPYYIYGNIYSGYSDEDSDQSDYASLFVNSYCVHFVIDKYESKTNLSSTINDFRKFIEDRDEKLKPIIPVYRKIINSSRTVSGLIEQVPELKDEIFKILRVAPCAGRQTANTTEDDDMKKLLMFRERNGIQTDAV